MATLDAKGRSLGSYCQGNWCRWNAQTEKKESAWFWPLNWKSEWQTLTLWLFSLIKVSLFWPYYGSLKGFQSNPFRLAATKSADAFDVQGTVVLVDMLANPAAVLDLLLFPLIFSSKIDATSICSMNFSVLSRLLKYFYFCTNYFYLLRKSGFCFNVPRCSHVCRLREASPFIMQNEWKEHFKLPCRSQLLNA